MFPFSSVHVTTNAARCKVWPFSGANARPQLAEEVFIGRHARLCCLPNNNAWRCKRELASVAHPCPRQRAIKQKTPAWPLQPLRRKKCAVRGRFTARGLSAPPQASETGAGVRLRLRSQLTPPTVAPSRRARPNWPPTSHGQPCEAFGARTATHWTPRQAAWHWQKIWGEPTKLFASDLDLAT